MIRRGIHCVGVRGKIAYKPLNTILSKKGIIFCQRFSTNTNKSSNKITAENPNKTYFSAFLRWYSDKLDSHPITTKCISSGIVSGFGDLICQGVTMPSDSEGKKARLTLETWDAIRTGRFVALSTVWIGPLLHYWYGALSQVFPNRVVLRVAIDQFFAAPVFVSSFLSLLWLWEGETRPEEIPERVKENVPGIVVANWTLWIPAQAVNFRYLPPKFQVLFSNFVGLVWNVYLSYMSRSENQKHKPIIDQDWHADKEKNH